MRLAFICLFWVCDVYIEICKALGSGAMSFITPICTAGHLVLMGVSCLHAFKSLGRCSIAETAAAGVF